MSAGPPPEDDRALAERHRAGRAQLSHLRQLLAVLDWAAAHLPEPEPEPEREPWEDLDDPFDEPDPYVSNYDGSEDEFHYGGEVWAGSQETPEFRAWLEDKERRFGPVTIGGGLGGLVDCHVSGRKFVGKLPSPEYTAWRERQHRRTEASLARTLDRARNAGPDRRQAMTAPLSKTPLETVQPMGPTPPPLPRLGAVTWADGRREAPPPLAPPHANICWSWLSVAFPAVMPETTREYTPGAWKT